MPTRINSARRWWFAIAVMSLNGCPTADLTNPKGNSPPPIPFQGPVDPSFETGTSWQLAFTLGNALTQAGSSYAVIQTGTGFLPSNGVSFASMHSYSNIQQTAPSNSVFQDNVDLTHSSSLSFDYTAEGLVGAGGGTATLQVLFTANGTLTLWSKTIDSTTSMPVQKKGETVSLPTTTSAGRFTVRLVILGGRVNQGGLIGITPTNMTFGIDNLVVK